MNDDLNTAEGCSLELFCSDTGEANSFPDLWDISFLCCLVCLDVIFEHDVNLSKFLIVSNSLEKDFGSIKAFGFEASLTNLQ